MHQPISLISLIILSASTILPGSVAAEARPPVRPAIAAEATNQSAEALLAQHLTRVGAKMYGGAQCPYSLLQRQLFGAAFTQITYIECAARGKSAAALCQTAHIQMTPTWEINGHLYRGVRSLEQLARLSGYHGPTDFHSASLR